MIRTLLYLSVATALQAAEPEFYDVFIAGRDGYPSVRIPSVVGAKSGAVLAFAEGRQKHTDQAENDIILKRSQDGGRTGERCR